MAFYAGFLKDFIPEVNYLFGGNRHFLEAGFGFSFPEDLLMPKLGYRFQANNGLIFRVHGMYMQSTKPDSFGDFPWLGISCGYGF